MATQIQSHLQCFPLDFVKPCHINLHINEKKNDITKTAETVTL